MSNRNLLTHIEASRSSQVREMHEIFDEILRKQPTRKVSKLKEIFKISLALIHGKDGVAELTSLIE